jgi:uncharacterized protein (TIGR02172 family)
MISRYNVISMSTVLLGKPIAFGRTAEIYAWGEGQILKLFQDQFSVGQVEYEARIAAIVHAAGLPIPAVGEVVEINGRAGLIYERVAGVSMLETFKAKPGRFFQFARLLAELQAEMHTCRVPELPSLRQRLEKKIREAETLPSDMRRAILATLDRLPDDDCLCHGDFHPDNVLLTARGPIIIDWTDATCGSPLADVARTSLLLRVGALPSGPSALWLLSVGRRWFRLAYLKRYFQLRPGDPRQLSAWQPVIAAARLKEKIPGEQEQLLALIKEIAVI